jgi:hypothetical protein
MNAKGKLGVLERQVTSFASMADLPTYEDRKRALLGKCDEAYDTAKSGRNYTDKHGEVHANPDGSGMVRCIELAARIMGVLTEAERRAKDGDGDSRAADLEEVAKLMRLAGYLVAKAA